MNLSNITSLFFKKRFIFITDLDNYLNLNFDEKNNDVSFEYISKINFNKVIDIYGSSENDLKMKILKNRLDYPNIWKGIIAILNNNPVGCHWILLPSEDILIYDSFELDNKSALFCGVYVNPNYRGKHIYNSMQFFAYNMWINNFSNRNVITIVEEKNKSSLKSNLRIGLEIKGVNFLLKFFGNNIFSIFYQYNCSVQIWNVIKRKNDSYESKSCNNL